MKKAFTLIELLVVIAIIAILAAILFPVFAQAKAAAKKTQAISNAKNAGTSMLIYTVDFDDRYALAFFSNTYSVAPPDADSNIHFATFPYAKSADIWVDPMDSTTESQRVNDPMIVPPSLVPAQYRSSQRVLNMGFKSNFGVNGQFLHPQEYKFSTTSTDHKPITQTQIGSPAKTIYSISSVWDRSPSGSPRGGGNYEVDAPCVFDGSFNDLRPGMQNAEGWWWFGGWNPSSTNAWNVFGGVWPWHGNNVVITYTDGHTKTRPMNQVAAGCNVSDGWGGTVFDLDAYEWDITQ